MYKWLFMYTNQNVVILFSKVAFGPCIGVIFSFSITFLKSVQHQPPFTCIVISDGSLMDFANSII